MYLLMTKKIKNPAKRPGSLLAHQCPYLFDVRHKRKSDQIETLDQRIRDESPKGTELNALYVSQDDMSIALQNSFVRRNLHNIQAQIPSI